MPLGVKTKQAIDIIFAYCETVFFADFAITFDWIICKTADVLFLKVSYRGFQNV